MCRSNACKHYDPKGQSEKAFVKGVESCGACGCTLQAKVRCLDCICGLYDLGKTPLWYDEAN